MAPTDGAASTAAARNEAPASGDPIPGPTILFWMVCFALNAMAAPSGSDIGLGYEPRWLPSLSPVIPVFDAIHIVGTWLVLYYKSGRSYRLATAETLLNRVLGGSGVTQWVRKERVRTEIGSVLHALQQLYQTIPARTGSILAFSAFDHHETARVIAELQLQIILVRDEFNSFISSGRAHHHRKALAGLSNLLDEESKVNSLLGLLLGLNNQHTKKDEISRLVSNFKSTVIAAQRFMGDCEVRDHTKARSAIKSLIETMNYRWFCFTLGVLPQFIKLFGSRGILWCQVCGAGYLASWAIFEALVVAAKLMNLDKPDTELSRAWDSDSTRPGNNTDATNCLSLSGTTVERAQNMPVDGLPEKNIYLDLLSISLGAMSVLGHTLTCTFLFVVGKARADSYHCLALMPIWINDFSNTFPLLHNFSGIVNFTIFGMSVLAILRLSFTLCLGWASGETTTILERKDLLVFTGALVASRGLIGTICVSDSARSKLLTGLRVVFYCVPTVYYFLVRYDDDGTELLSWAEWLG
ncbi:hypothetical protein PFICI_06498 [Pestalotiopsis fici W106-1]|uniref:Uncharacterized protein n=1 Tax=Pestalotiopsis fici (strain W106-1 / CGMCC3.15140) TaxID=1229662 RepID=W3X8I1_PESFW|nr:uncharacterized protein PFICI_06498 [Pestalotiopsis fici W106-1]ETS81496.1 hypothetical protein PFICI_06498 [Pestalotiopsis fici W106-1]